MRVGKLNWDDLKYIIDNHKGITRDEVRISNGVGEDCAVINYGDYECVISTDPVTGADKNIGKIAVHINCNDIASCGIEPLGVLVTILAPPTTTLDELHEIMREIHQETSKLNVQVIGGHTEITEAVNKVIISCTAIGKGLVGSAISTAGAKIGDDIVVTKYLCLEGTSILVNDFHEKSREILEDEEIQEAKRYIDYLSVVEEGKIAGRLKVNSMHDITEGGVLGALWELSKASDVGFKVYENKMPITNITKKLCEKFNIDPLKFISSGSMIITCKNGYELVDKLKEQGINGSVIGKITSCKGILVVNNKDHEVEPPEADELFNL
ncbi:AIR synthase family protein [Clostridium sp.]|uniref:AIR synthase family protein n=1 Tax=Clostridium sp. TaxID=1506 RepID=UPI002FC8539A